MYAARGVQPHERFCEANMMCFGKDNSGSFQTAVCPKLYQKNCVTKVTTVQHRHSGKVRFRDRIEAFVLNGLKCVNSSIY